MLNDLNDDGVGRGECLVQELGDGFAVRAARAVEEEALDDNFAAMRNMVACESVRSLIENWGNSCDI